DADRDYRNSGPLPPLRRFGCGPFWHSQRFSLAAGNGRGVTHARLLEFGPAMTINIALTGLARDLAARADAGKPIRVGVIGSGEMGTDLVTQMSLMQGIEMAAIATRRPQTALDAMTIAYGED